MTLEAYERAALQREASQYDRDELEKHLDEAFRPVDIGDRLVKRENGKVIREFRVTCMYPHRGWVDVMDRLGRKWLMTYDNVEYLREPK
jgi:hypothetical protein